MGSPASQSGLSLATPPKKIGQPDMKASQLQAPAGDNLVLGTTAFHRIPGQATVQWQPGHPPGQQAHQVVVILVVGTFAQKHICE